MMSHGVSILHSHSAIERDLRFGKSEVLIDEEYKDRFLEAKPFEYKGKMYYKVNVLNFVLKGGTFMNLVV